MPSPSRETPSIIKTGAFSDRILATDEEMAESDRVEAERLARENSHMDRVLNAMFTCRACGTGNTLGSSSGLCVNCQLVIRQIHAEQAMTESVNGTSRRQLCEEFLSRQER